MKTCRDCHTEKPESEFRLNGPSTTLRACCKHCETRYRHAWIQANPERAAAYQTSDRLLNKAWRKAYDIRQMEGLSDSYVARLLGLSVVAVPTHLLQLKRQQLRLIRLLNEKKA